jgi:hypothetical protein
MSFLATCSDMVVSVGNRPGHMLKSLAMWCKSQDFCEGNDLITRSPWRVVQAQI